MIAFFKRYAYPDITIKLIVLYALNVMDILFTSFLVNTGFFIEANPIMAVLMNNALVTVLFKILMPAAVFVFLAVHLRHAAEKLRRSANRLIGMLLVVYIGVTLLHISWIIVYYVMCV